MVTKCIIGYLGLMKLGDFSVIKNKYIHLLVQLNMSLMKWRKFEGNHTKKRLFEKIKKYYGIKYDHPEICKISDQNSYGYKITDCNNLRHLDYAIFASMMACENIQILSFSNCNIHDRSFELLLDCKFQYIKDIELNKNEGLTNYVIEIISRFNTTTEFTSLTINDCNIDSDGIYMVTQNERFKYIKIFTFKFKNGTRKDKCERKWFYNMRKLILLTFRETQIKNWERIEHEKPQITVNAIEDEKKKEKKKKGDNDSTKAIK